MLNKFFLDSDYTVMLLLNEQVPVSMNEELWDNSIDIEIDADNTPDQYLEISNGEDTTILTVTPGQLNLLSVDEQWWAYGGVTTITPYKNGTAVGLDKVIDITFPEEVNNAGMISSTVEDPEALVEVGQHYEMSGSEYAEEAVQEIQQEVQNLQENKQEKLVAGSGISIDPATNVISATGGGGGINYSDVEQDTGLTWINGQHVYQRSFYEPVNMTNNNQSISLGNIRTALPISMDAFLVESYGARYTKIPYFYSDTNYIMVTVGKTSITINKGQYTSISSGSYWLITIRYTKEQT